MEDYLKMNKASWNKVVQSHWDSEFYDNQNFIKGQSSLNDIEHPLLGNLENKSLLHLQCHFGQDSISLARLGAEVTAVDFSEEAIAKAQELSQLTQQPVDFICSDVYALPEHHQGLYDVVFSSYGTIGWLPDIVQWANVVHHFLRPGGRVLLVEFHPFVWMYDEKLENIEYSYFNREKIVEKSSGSYADPDSGIAFHSTTWNHPLSDVFQAVLSNGMQITQFKEYDYSPYQCFSGMEKVGDRKFRIKDFGDKFPLVYALEAIKPK